jgi:short-chain fatty acids transporter
MATRESQHVGRRGIMQRFTMLCVRYVERLMPDPYLFAVILTLIVVGLVALLVGGATPAGVLKAWYGGVWGPQNIFTFAFQMVLVLVTGYTLAEAPVVKRAIVRVASKPTNQVQGALLCFGVSTVFSLLNWGLGLVAGALVARQVAKRLTGVHFGYLVATGFMGYLVWTQGLSSSIALANTDTSSPINVIHKMTGTIVPLRLTVFQPYNWVAVIVVVALLAVTIWRMAPSDSLEPDPAVFDEEPEPDTSQGGRTFAERLEDLWILNVLVFAAGITYFVLSGFALNISSMIMLFTITITSALPHGTPIRFIRAFSGAAKVSGPLLLQYPLYGGIAGLLGYLPDGSGRALQTVLAGALVRGADQFTLPFLTFVGCPLTAPVGWAGAPAR